MFSDCRKRISKTAIERAVKLRFRQAGVTRNVSPHRLRDVFLTAMTDTLGLSSASDLAGPSMATTTEGYYRKHRPSRAIPSNKRQMPVQEPWRCDRLNPRGKTMTDTTTTETKLRF